MPSAAIQNLAETEKLRKDLFAEIEAGASNEQLAEMAATYAFGKADLFDVLRLLSAEREDLVKSLASSLDGIDGYESERDHLSPYWHESHIEQARQTLDKAVGKRVAFGARHEHGYPRPA